MRVTLTSYQVTSCFTSSARPNVKTTKYTPDRRSVANPTASASATPSARRQSPAPRATAALRPATATVYAPTPKNATVASETRRVGPENMPHAVAITANCRRLMPNDTP